MKESAVDLFSGASGQHVPFTEEADFPKDYISSEEELI
jgi:hypothetical protein